VPDQPSPTPEWSSDPASPVFQGYFGPICHQPSGKVAVGRRKSQAWQGNEAIRRGRVILLQYVQGKDKKVSNPPPKPKQEPPPPVQRDYSHLKASQRLVQELRDKYSPDCAQGGAK
jgi:hypothetical protein